MAADIRRGLSASAATAVLAALVASGCSGSPPSRFNPGLPAAPADLTATPGNGQVTLAWSPASNAAAYHVYSSTSAGVTAANGVKVSGNVTTTSFIATGLSNGIAHYFVVTSLNSSGESGPSNEVSATPVAAGAFSQADLQGVWRFHLLSAGTSPGWMRGTLTVDGAGAVTIDRFEDSSGDGSAPAALFPQLLVSASGQVRDAQDAAAASFTGVLAPTHRNTVVGTSSSSGTQSIAVLLKHDPAVAFSPATSTSPGDLGGFGGASGGPGGGSRKFAYDQIATGASRQEWEFAEGQIGKSLPLAVQYENLGVLLPFLTASSDAARPSDKATTIAISTDGVVDEAINPAAPAPVTLPEFVVTEGTMSDDKTVIVDVGTTTDARFVLRIYGIMNLTGDDTHAFALGDLAGSYVFQKLVVGANPLTASGTLQIDASGNATFPSYLDSAGGTAPPEPLALAMDASPVAGFYGIVTDTTDASLHGKESYFKDLLVVTRTEVSGESSLVIALK